MRARTLEQVGVAWILSCVFVCILEARGHLERPRLAGEGAQDSEHLFFELFPSLTLRDYLLAVFRELSHVPGGEDVLGPAHNPAWRLSPSPDVARALVALFREADGDGALVWRDWYVRDDTRFLGDLYQNVSEGVRERYALLQTPRFVEDFILDLTLSPAIKEYGLERVRLLDPTCGSGHFLLGAFRRIFEARCRELPGVTKKEHAAAALGQVYGVDLNPYAVAIARFRLVLAYLEAAEIDKLKAAPEVKINLVVADSLLHYARGQSLMLGSQLEEAGLFGAQAFRLEDPEEAARILGGEYHAVVGNPPYITCKDSALREKYRALYDSASGKFALAAPFAERFFTFAGEGAFVGMINANSFMKREFGKNLIEKVFPRYELTHVMDTSGAYIPGHGTPTVLLFGRRRVGTGSKIAAVLGRRGEPETPAEPEKGHVWSSIRDHHGTAGFENEYISVAEVDAATFAKHPWSLGGGGAAELKELLEARAVCHLVERVTIGVGGMSNADDVFNADSGEWKRFGMPAEHVRSLAIGEEIRDWCHTPSIDAYFPYSTTLELEEPTGRELQLLWPYRATLGARVVFGGGTYQTAGRSWWEWHQLTKERYRTPLSVTFAFVATHNHFVLDRGGKVFSRSAPIIKLPEGATEEEHLALLAYLNSSTAAFYFRQAGHSKGIRGEGGGITAEAWEQFLEYSGALVGSVPLPMGWSRLSEYGRRMEQLAKARAGARPEMVNTPKGLEDARSEDVKFLEEMVALQEVIDFEVYRLWGLIDQTPDPKFAVAPGSRPFEVELARSNKTTRWFDLNRYSRPETDAPGLAELSLPSTLMLIEQPEYKRRWTIRSWNEELTEAVRQRGLDHIEHRMKRSVSPWPLRELVGQATIDEGLEPLVSTAFGEGVELATFVRDVVSAEAVPYLAALRYTDSGLEKRALWEKTWDLQRMEDAGQTVNIPVPPKYDSKDFASATFWRLRGKLDVPKERFISYPGAEKDDDKSPLFGWAGWDHLQQATALAGLYQERKDQDGWGADEGGKARLVPLLAGLLELVPWLKQWHNAPEDDFGGEGPGDWYERYVEGEARAIGRGLDDLRKWRPEKGRGKR